MDLENRAAAIDVRLREDDLAVEATGSEQGRIEYVWSESVSASDFARVLSGYAEQGQGLIMGDAFGTEKITRRVARD